MTEDATNDDPMNDDPDAAPDPAPAPSKSDGNGVGPREGSRGGGPPTLRNVDDDAVAYDHRTGVESAIYGDEEGDNDGEAGEGNDGPNATIDQFVENGSYLVEVKRSARKRNPAVGEAVFADGAYHRFDDRETADEWARALAEAGDRTVWVQDAPPHDRSPFDGYLVGRRPIRPAEAPFESEQKSLPDSA